MNVPFTDPGEIHRIHFLRHKEIVDLRRAKRVEPTGGREQNAGVFQRVIEIIR